MTDDERMRHGKGSESAGDAETQLQRQGTRSSDTESLVGDTASSEPLADEDEVVHPGSADSLNDLQRSPLDEKRGHR